MSEQNETIDLTLEVKEIQSWQPKIIINPAAILTMTADTLEELKKDLREQMDEQNGTEEFSEVDEVWSALREPRIKRDKDGKPERDQMGRGQALPFSIDDQRWRNRVLNAVDQARIKKPDKTIKISFYETAQDQRPKYEDLVELAKIMKVRLSEYTRVMPILPALHDKYIDLQKQAEALIEKKK